MRLIRFGSRNHEKPGLLRGERIVDLRALFPKMPDIGEAFFRDGWLQKAAAVEAPGQIMETRIGCPVTRPSKIVCLGINYFDHGAEGGFKAPERPILFAKSPSALNGPYDPIVLPGGSGQVDWEVELALVIGREGKRIAARSAWDHVAGYSLMNDVSAREAQFSDGQWFRGKSFDTFAPMGPALVTPDEISDPADLVLTSRVNGTLMQTGSTGDLIFGIPEIIEFVSRDMTLLPGDVISTGTPAGVGIFRDPPITLQPGDVVECRIDAIGTLRNRVEAAA